MDVRLNKVKQLLDLGSKNVLAVGIWGMGGIGKTTIAELTFELIRNKFESSCFVQNVKEKTLEGKGLCNIQTEILHKCLLDSSVSIQNSVDGKKTLIDKLCGRRVLIVLDDVNRSQDLECLIGERESRHRWFGEGSRIIITTRDKHLLKANGVNDIYEVPRLSFDEPRQLLLQKAFKGNSPSSIEEYRDAIEGIVRYANGHPLALKVLGSSLHERNVNYWMDTLDRLKQYPHKEILGSLKVSFDGLDELDKEIFLDLCIFNDLFNRHVEEMLRSFRSNLDISISNLVSKSLITIEKNERYGMHDLLSKMGKLIINQESPHNPGKRSRVWDFNDLQEVLTNNKGSEAVEVIFHIRPSSLLRWNVDSLWKMPNLKCLISQGAIIEFSRRPCMVLKKLTVIDLRYSKIIFDNIDFSIAPNLQRLYLSGVCNVRKLDQSIGCLQHLVHLDLSIESLPSNIYSLTSLQSLNLSNSKCSKCQLSEDIGNLNSLMKLKACSNTAIQKLPSYVVHLSKLKKLDLNGCVGLQLPNSLSGLCSLEILDLTGCGLGDGAIPDDIGSLSSLKKLRLRDNNFVSIPESIFQLSQLTCLSIRGCQNLKYLPKHLPFSLEIDAQDCHLLARDLPMWNTDDLNRLLYEDLIMDHILRRHLFIIIWPLFEIPMGCESRESCKIKFTSSRSSFWYLNLYGYALRVVYKVLGLDDGYSTFIESTHVRKDFLCYFNTNQGPLKHPLEFDILISKRAGLYELLMYIPIKWFGDQLDGARFLQASVDSMDGSHVTVYNVQLTLLTDFDPDYFYNLVLRNPDFFIMTNHNNEVMRNQFLTTACLEALQE